MKYVALLRGINVGGNNIIKMTLLKACIEGLGFENVATYIASGNVLFESAEKDIAKLEATIEKALSKTFEYDSRVVVVSEDELREAVKKAPRGFGADPAKYRYDVLFLKEPLSAKEAMKSVEIRDGVDKAWPGKKVLYFSRLISKVVQSKISKLAGMPVYKSMTIRNWNTTTKLLALLDKGGAK